MLTGAAYISHHNPKHIETDIQEMKQLQMDDVLVCAQELDFTCFKGKVKFTPKIAKDYGIRPIAIFWGALNLFGGGRSSQFLLEHPEGFQVALDGSHRKGGCYVNPICVARIKEMIDESVAAGFEAYFVDEPTPLAECYCPSCRRQYAEWYQGDLATAPAEQQKEYRARCVLAYVRNISDYCKAHYPALETMCCLMPRDQDLWRAGSEIASLDNLGTDIYWANNTRYVEEATPLIQEMEAICQRTHKIHHEWLQAWTVRAGNEDRVLQQGKILVRERPHALYVWAWLSQIGIYETSDNPELSWAKAVEVLRLAKEQ